jgi:hypothetical protein
MTLRWTIPFFLLVGAAGGALLGLVAPPPVPQLVAANEVQVPLILEDCGSG